MQTFFEHYPEQGEIVAACYNTLGTEGTPLLKELSRTHPEIFGTHPDVNWLGETLRYPVSGIPTCRSHVCLGNYSKAPLSFGRSLESIYERDYLHDRPHNFANASIELLKGSLRGYVDNEGRLPYALSSEEALCRVTMEILVITDEFPFNLPYDANVPQILAKFSPDTKQRLDKFHVLVGKCVIEVLVCEDTSRDVAKLPVLTLGTVPHEAWNKRKMHSRFPCSVRLPHPCSLLDPGKTCGKARFEEGDAALDRIFTSAFGEGSNSKFFMSFFNKNEKTIETVLAVRRISGYGGKHETEAQKEGR